MIAAVAIDDTLMNPYEAEWRILRAHRLNLLLEGPAIATNAVLRLLQPHLPEPIRWRQPQRGLILPSEETGALILKDVTSLSVDDQRRLLDWIVRTGSQTQIVSTTDRPLFALVTRGLFDEALYYRLNLMLLHIGSRNSRQSQSDDDERALSSSQPASTL
jgi:transcriptional regulator of aromatic amino acid metabolism